MHPKRLRARHHNSYFDPPISIQKKEPVIRVTGATVTAVGPRFDVIGLPTGLFDLDKQWFSLGSKFHINLLTARPYKLECRDYAIFSFKLRPCLSAEGGMTNFPIDSPSAARWGSGAQSLINSKRYNIHRHMCVRVLYCL